MTIGSELVFWATANPWWYALFASVVSCFVAFHYFSMRRWILSVASGPFVGRFFTGASRSRFMFRWVTLSVALAFLVVAACRPQWGKKEDTVVREGRDIVVLLDISRSMQAADLAPTRLEAAKLKLKMLLSKLSCERLALILFSGSAFVQSPLTIDYHAFSSYLDQVDSEVIASGTTAVDKALLKGLDLFDAGSTSATKIMLLVTDGEDFSAHLEQVEARVKKAGVQVVALGVGSEAGAPIPRKDHAGRVVGFEQDAHGKTVLSKCNMAYLEKIAAKLNGVAVQVSSMDEDLDALVAHIHAQEKKQFDERSVSFAEERYPIAVGCAALFYAVNALI